MTVEIITIIILIFIIIHLIYRLHKWKKACNLLLKKHQSQAVKHGNTIEQFIPFMTNFPYTKQNFKFLGKPIDGITFEQDKIVFLEFKTGTSQLSQKQKNIKNLIESKKVEWKELRY